MVGLVVVAAALLALGALPQFLASGDAYHLTATATESAGPAVNVTDLSDRRYPYLTAALDSGRSPGYRRGPVGFKEAFTHSPFDEVDALAARDPTARVGDGAVLVVDDGERYRVEVTA